MACFDDPITSSPLPDMAEKHDVVAQKDDVSLCVMQAMTELPSAGGDVEVLQPVFRFMFDLMRRVRSALCKETLHTVANRHQLSACECQLPRHAVVDLTVSSARAPGAELHSSFDRTHCCCSDGTEHSECSLIALSVPHTLLHVQNMAAGVIERAVQQQYDQQVAAYGGKDGAAAAAAAAGGPGAVLQVAPALSDKLEIAVRSLLAMPVSHATSVAMISVYDKKTASDDGCAGRSGNRCAGWLHCIDGCMRASDGSNSNGLRPDSVMHARLRGPGRGVTAVSTTLPDAQDPRELQAPEGQADEPSLERHVSDMCQNILRQVQSVR